MPAPQTRAFQQQAFQEDVPPTDAFQNKAFQEGAFQFDVSGVGGISSAEAFGAPAVRRIVRTDGVGTAETFGTTLVRTVVATEAFQRNAFQTTDAFSTTISGVGGIASAEAFGTAAVRRLARSVGIASSEAFGTASILRVARNVGAIVSLEAFGVFKLLRRVVADAIGSAEAFGTLEEIGGIYDVDDPSIIESEEAFGIPIVSFAPSGTPTEAFQRDAFQTSSIISSTVLLSGIATAEAFGIARVGFATATSGGGGGGAGREGAAPMALEGRQVIVTLVAGARRVVLFDKRV